MHSSMLPLPSTPSIAAPYHDSRVLNQLRSAFKENDFVKLPLFLSEPIYNLVRQELFKLYAQRSRRHFVMPGFETERKLSVVGGARVIHQSPLLISLYGNMELRTTLSAIVGEPIFTVNHAEEFMVINFLEGSTDTHGWHTDDPQYALIVITEDPGENNGGQVEYIPKWKDVCHRYGWTTLATHKEKIQEAWEAGLVKSPSLTSGDCYLLDAHSALHRVTPITGEGQRKALNMAFDNRIYRTYGDTAHLLYRA